MQSLRIEKALPLAGPDIPDDESRSPFHVGLDRWIRFDKQDFVGRDGLLRLQEMGVSERWVGLHVESDIAPRAGSRVTAVADFAPQRRTRKSGARAEEPIEQKSAGAQVGMVSSAARGHSVNKMLALAYVQTTHAFPGAHLMVDVEGDLRPAKVMPIPFFDPQACACAPRSNNTKKRSLKTFPLRLSFLRFFVFRKYNHVGIRIRSRRHWVWACGAACSDSGRKTGKRVAIVERKAVVGGVCINTGTIPSKTLREAVLHLSGYRERGLYGASYTVKQNITMSDLLMRTDHVIRPRN